MYCNRLNSTKDNRYYIKLMRVQLVVLCYGKIRLITRNQLGQLTGVHAASLGWSCTSNGSVYPATWKAKYFKKYVAGANKDLGSFVV